ncbi:MAG: class I SAM-dependent methyltransferase [Candidatus Methanomethylophilaceae archaeon]|nr:class I SAM-dependent methyltransferase [Candidatus Methanomethylophilaceae archaeon]
MNQEPPTNQFRCPEGEDGLKVLEHMNDHHVPLWEFVLSKMPSSVDGCIVDVGCGGGGFLLKMYSKYPYAMYHGVDISDTCLGKTREMCADMVSEGSLELHRSSVESMPFGDGTVDVVTANETYFFWPDLDAALKEISRILSEGGLLMVSNEMAISDSNRAEVQRSSEEYGTRIIDDEVLLRKMSEVGLDGRVYRQGDWAVYKARKV